MAYVVFMAEDEEVADSLSRALAVLGHDAVGVKRPAEIGRLQAGSPDVIVVHRRNLTALARAVGQLRGREQTWGIPVLAVLTAPATLDLGDKDEIEEFMLHPFRDTELAARLRVLLSRRRHRDIVLRVGGLIVDATTHTVTVDGVAVTLTFKEFSLLRFLMGQRGRVISRPVLFKQVWGGAYQADSRTVDVHVRRLRSKLGERYGRLIGTVRGVGYFFC